MNTKVCKLEAVFSSISCSDQTPPHYPFSPSLFLLPLDVLKPYRSRLKYPRNQLLHPPPKKNKSIVQVEKPNLDIRFDEETLFHLITRMKMRGREKLDAAAAGGAKVFNFHLFKQHKYSYK
jgi:hypothetical protein